MTTNNGGPAFPAEHANHDESRNGMTLLDYFAAAALQGYRAGKHLNGGAYPSEVKLWSSSQVAKASYDDAYAMLAERERRAT